VQNEIDDERMGELLMQRVTGALSAPEADALAAALAKLPPDELARWEAAAAELSAAFLEAEAVGAEPMAAALAERIVAGGEAVVRAQPRPQATIVLQAARRPTNYLAWTGWLSAAAALGLWAAGPRTTEVVPVKPPVVVASAAQLRDSLLTRDSVTERLEWSATKDSSALGASGDVVWSNRAQRGVMRIVGLQANDRSRWQYQLWIFDKTRDQKYPVDGGVFDVPPGRSEVLVPIDARVPVGDAVMFAVTVEHAGGVVVSTRERIALLAQRKT
jgi:hypothetical protein